MENKPVSICVVGSGYVGLVAAVCFAEMGHDVTCVDNDKEKIAVLATGGVPIYEEHLDDLLKKHLDRNLRFTTDLKAAVGPAEAVFIAVGTPQSDSGAADLFYVETVASQIAGAISSYKVVVEKSTVPVSTSRRIKQLFQRMGVPSDDFDVVSNPEFLREGTAVMDFLHPDRIVVGAPSERAAELMRRIYAPLTTGAYYAREDAMAGTCNPTRPARALFTSAESAEIIKHASNAFLAMKISFINAVSNLAEAVDADIEDIAAGMGMDRRIGQQFLRAGLGYGGSCFPKDVAAFKWVAAQSGFDFQLLDEISKINDRQRDRFFEKITGTLWTLRGKKLAVLGLAFKNATDDIRESPAMDIVAKLLAAGAEVVAYDPAAMDRASTMLPAGQKMHYAASVLDAASGADAVLILTDWKEFAEIDLNLLGAALRFPIVIDGRNLFDSERMARAGFTYISVGRPPVHPAQTRPAAFRLSRPAGDDNKEYAMSLPLLSQQISQCNSASDL